MNILSTFRVRWRRMVSLAAILAATLAATALVSTYQGLTVIEPSGEHAVGRWRGEVRDETGSGLGVVVWYPAERGTGRPADYFADLDRLADALVTSGQLSSLETRGLQYVRDGAREGARVAATVEGWPLLVFSPGNATNVEFYASIAEDLASRGYVVVGLNHPGQVPVTDLASGVVVYRETPLPRSREAFEAATADRVSARVSDIVAAIDWLDDSPPPALVGALDLGRVGVIGHSLGGIAAAEACGQDARIDACVNLDGLQGGGPYGVSPHTVALTKPFMFITKETGLPEGFEALLESGSTGTFKVVIPGAHHDEFADGASFEPRLFPWQTSARDTVVVARGFAAAFFDRHLANAPEGVLGEVDAPRDVTLIGYPLSATVSR